MVKNLKKKILFLILIGITIYLVVPFFLEEPENNFVEDNIRPSTSVRSPVDRSWHNKSFKVTILDSDLGSGLAECEYIVEDLGTGRVARGFRDCGSAEKIIPVGEICTSSYNHYSSEGRCMVSSRAIDKAGNDSGWKGNIYNIDLIKPTIILDDFKVLELDQEHEIQASVLDNSRIIGCWLYIDGKITDERVDISPIPCEYNEQCFAISKYTFSSKGKHTINFACKDIAGNYGFGSPVEIGIALNKPPEISFCRVTPSQGDTLTQFNFEVSAKDENELSYSWDFGDGNSSEEESPIHNYASSGIYKPKVVVSDGQESVECSTAWVTIITN